MNAPLLHSALASPADGVRTRLLCKDIIVGDRLRKVLPDRVQALRESFADKGQTTPIDTVATPNGPRLIAGAHRLGAAFVDDASGVDAILWPEGHFGSEAEIQQREITENFERFDLNALERAVNIAAWRVIHESRNPPAKPGRKAKAPMTDEALDEMSATFALNFSEVAQRVLGISRRSVFLSLKIATISAEVRDRLADLATANNQSDLLALAAEAPARQSEIVDLLVAGSASVATAIAALDGIVKPVASAAHEKVSESFSRLKPEQQFSFFDLHADAIEKWRMGRGR